MYKIVFSCVVLITTLGNAQESLIRKWTKDLCSPDMHGRGYVFGGDSIAANYLEKEFSTLGLSPVPGQTSMFQKFSFPVNTFPGRMMVILDESETVPGRDFIVAPASGSFEGELSAFTISKTNLFDFPTAISIKKHLALKGFNSLLLDLDGVGKDSLQQFGVLLEQLKDEFPIVELYKNKFTWSLAQNEKRYPHVYLRDSLYHGQSIRLIIDNEMRPQHTANNVVAYLPAKKKTSKTLYFTAHYDHLGRMGDQTYFPGANDNASGTAMLLELARYFKTNPPKYNLVFVAFAAEEVGLLGSRYYVQKPFTPLQDIRFLVNLDIMGSGEEGITVVNATLFPKAFKKLTRINKKEKLLSAIKARGPAANSDHYFFTEKGVPSIFIYTQGPNKHYHDIYDTFDELSFAEYEDLIKLLQQFVNKI